MKSRWIKYLRICLLSVLGMILIFADESSIYIFAEEIGVQENSEEIFEETVQAEETTEMNDMVNIETSIESNISQMEQGQISFRQYIPYNQFVNYRYQGDGSMFQSKDIILEYAPDANGIFQVSSFTDSSTSAYIYQVRETGLYELANIPDYYTVEDLRYSAQAMDGSESLILPSNLSLGMSYYTGYDQSIQRTIVEQIPSYNLGGHIFNNVLRIEEVHFVESGKVIYNYYFAPVYGIIQLTKIDEAGNTQSIFQLISTQGSIGQ